MGKNCAKKLWCEYRVVVLRIKTIIAFSTFSVRRRPQFLRSLITRERRTGLSVCASSNRRIANTPPWPSRVTPAADGKIPVLKGRESGFKKYQGGPLKYIDCGQKVLNPVLLSLLSHDHGGHAGAPNVNFRKILACVAWRFCRAGRRSGVAANRHATQARKISVRKTIWDLEFLEHFL